MAERLAGLEREQATLAAGARAAVAELERRPPASRLPLYLSFAAVAFGAAALAFSLLR